MKCAALPAALVLVTTAPQSELLSRAIAFFCPYIFSRTSRMPWLEQWERPPLAPLRVPSWGPLTGAEDGEHLAKTARAMSGSKAATPTSRCERRAAPAPWT